jgi:protein-S-isoprenylcysteine O-methyltransferase Ste14
MTPLRLVATALYLAAFPAAMLLIAGDARWWPGWIFGAWFTLMSGSVMVHLQRHDPALLAERYRKPGTGGQSAGDKRLVYLIALAWLTWIVSLPLDARLHLSPPLPLAVAIAGGALLLVSWIFFYRAFADNTFTSPLVRIQKERGHRVVSTGVYGIVRHPMYLAAACMFFGAPLMARALLGLVTGALGVAVLIVRIAVEEKLLVAELDGYADYRARVRWRLIPYIW